MNRSRARGNGRYLEFAGTWRKNAVQGRGGELGERETERRVMACGQRLVARDARYPSRKATGDRSDIVRPLSATVCVCGQGKKQKNTIEFQNGSWRCVAKPKSVFEGVTGCPAMSADGRLHGSRHRVEMRGLPLALPRDLQLEIFRNAIANLFRQAFPIPGGRRREQHL